MQQLRISQRPHSHSTTKKNITNLRIPQSVNRHQINQIPISLLPPLPLPPLTSFISIIEEEEDTEMEDCCVVCAEPLEWIAYGPCGHRDVCATCIARLRFVCNDRRCCICKSDSDVVFVTKALGDYSKSINDFSIFPEDAKEGKAGSYWYHADIKAYFDDLDPYKVIKAMCRLSCSICDVTKGEAEEGSKRSGKFKKIEQLKGHLFHQHGVLFCSLCLEGRKVFLCKQKLYNRAQLKQHIKGGDSAVDGSESERCGFSGHPPCEFCHVPFYGDNELYRHMSTEHYTCHLCQRVHPGQYQYHKDYDDLENHFRYSHFLCEENTCLEKKFIVFTSETEMKRHNALEHGGQMSRSKRSNALQVPTGFQFQQRGRGRVRNFSSDQRNHSIVQDSSETACETMVLDAATNGQAISATRETSQSSSTGRPRVVVSSSDNHSSLGHSQSEALLGDSSFPPLPTAQKRRRSKSKNSALVSRGSSMAARLRSQADTNQPATIFSRSSSSSNSQASVSSSNRPVSINACIGTARSTTASEPPSTCSVTSSDEINGSKVGLSCTSRFGQTARNGEPVLTVEDVQSSKLLVERICAALDNDKDKYAAFKIVSKEYREGLIDVREYVAYIHQFGLSHLLSDLARLCPDSQKKRELMEMHDVSLRSWHAANKELSQSNRSANTESKGSRKGKEKCEDSGSSSLRGTVDTLTNGVKQLQLNQNSASIRFEEQPRYHDTVRANKCNSDSVTGSKTEKKKKPKKTPKFTRTRLGESSVSSPSDLGTTNASQTAHNELQGRDEGTALGGTAARGVWRNGGGRKLVGMVQAWSG